MTETESLKKEIADLKAELIHAHGYRARAEAMANMADIGRTVISAMRQKGVLVPIDGGPTVPALAARYLRMGKDFDILMSAIKSDPTLQSEWERFCMSLRLVEGDIEV